MRIGKRRMIPVRAFRTFTPRCTDHAVPCFRRRREWKVNMQNFLGQVRYVGKGKLPSQRELAKDFYQWQDGKAGAFQVTVLSGAADRVKLGRCGTVKMRGAADLLMLDVDSLKPRSLTWLQWVFRRLNIGVHWIRYDRTAKGWHVIIRCRERFKALEIVALQAILGSDWRRETFNLARVRSGKLRGGQWNILFERKLS